jgi:hypothetical protein
MPLRRDPNGEVAVIAARLARGHGTSIPQLASSDAKHATRNDIVRPRHAAVNDLLAASSTSGTLMNNFNELFNEQQSQKL